MQYLDFGFIIRITERRRNGLDCNGRHACVLLSSFQETEVGLGSFVHRFGSLDGLRQPCVSTQPSIQWRYIQARLKYMKAHSNKTCVPACVSQISGPPGLPGYNRAYPTFPIGYGKENHLPLPELERLFQKGNETYLYAVCEDGEISWVSRVKEYLRGKGSPFWTTKIQKSEGILFPQELDEYVIDYGTFAKGMNTVQGSNEFFGYFSEQAAEEGSKCW